MNRINFWFIFLQHKILKRALFLHLKIKSSSCICKIFFENKTFVCYTYSMKFENYNKFIKFLEDNKDENKSEFDKKLISTKFKILGLKIPFLRKLAKEIVLDGQDDLILSNQNFIYYEQILIYGFVLAQIKIEESERIEKINNYIFCFDNWSVVDSFCSSLKKVKNNKSIYFDYIKKCFNNKNDFIIRFGIVLLMDYFLDEPDLEKILKLTLSCQKDSYYIQMAISWLFATSLAKNFKVTFDFLSNNKESLNLFVRKKIISKCNDSYRIEKEKKSQIKNLLS